jgi:hypothetical protein
MTRSPIRLVGVREPEYKRLKRKIEDEYHEKLRALDMVFGMSGGSSAKSGTNGARKSKGAVPQAVRNALQKITGEFSVRDIEQQIKVDDPASNFKRASISSTLKRLVGEEIIMTNEGKGKRGSKYRRKQ